MIKTYHNHKLQTNPRHREEEPHNNHETPGRETKQSNQPSPPNHKTRRGTKKRTTKHRTTTESMGVTINNKSTTKGTTAPERTAAQPTGGLNKTCVIVDFNVEH